MIKLLVITYYWPPAGGPGVQRVLKFVKYFPEYDVQPVILTVENGDYPAIDTSLVDEIPASVSVYRVKGWEPYKLYKRFTGMKSSEAIPVGILAEETSDSLRSQIAHWIRLNFFIPDARRFLIRPLVKKAQKIIEAENIDVIFTSSPPHSMQLVGLKLKKKTGIPWIGDFRDPWLSIDYYQKIKRTRIAIKKDAKLEKQVVNSLDTLVAVNKSLISDFHNKYDPQKAVLIYNGFDEDDFIGLSDIIRTDPNKFIILYYGNLGEDRIVPEFITAFDHCVKMTKDSKTNLKLKFIGSVHEGFRQLFTDASLSKHLEFLKYIPHEVLLKEAASASLLLLVINRVPHNKGILTGKLFEYLAFGIPILGIGPVDGEAAKILTETEGGIMVDYSDSQGMVRFIREQFESGLAVAGQQTLKTHYKRYSRRYLTGKLAGVIQSTIGENK